MRGCACGRTRGLSDRPLDSFGAVPFMIGSGIARFYQRYFAQYQTRKRRSRRVQGFGAPGKLSGGQFSAENGRQPRIDRKAPGALRRARTPSHMVSLSFPWTVTKRGSSRLVREIPLVRECACGRTRALRSPSGLLRRRPVHDRLWYCKVLSTLLCPIPNKEKAIPKGPGAIGKPLARSAERESPPFCFSRIFREAAKKTEAGDDLCPMGFVSCQRSPP